MYKLSNINTVKSLMQKYNMTFSKSLGQNFLINPSVCPRMALNTITKPDACVLEIGPGIGVLTQELAKLAGKVVAVEYDKRLLPLLSETLADFDNVSVINNDILKLDLRKVANDYFNGQNFSVCANLPYYISSSIIMKLLEDKLPIDCITIMLQKEMAQRICAKPGTRAVGAISLCISYYAEPELLFNVSKGSFMPAPKVDSSVVKLNVRKKPLYDVLSEKTLFKIIELCFANRRKMISNNLSSGLNIPKAKVEDVLKNKCSVMPDMRAEQLSLKQFVDVSNVFFEVMKNDKEKVEGN